MAIPQSTIDQILDRIDLVELIGSRIKLKKTGKTYTACCPFHQEKTPSFHVDRHKNFYHCFGCHVHGNAIGFLMQYENRDFIDVMKDLAQQASVELPKNRRDDNSKFNYKRLPAGQPPPVQQNAAALRPEATPTSTPNAATDPAFIAEHAPFESSYIPAPDYDDYPADMAWTQDYPAVEPADELPAAKEGDLFDLLNQVCQFYQKQLQQNSTAQAYLASRGLDEKAIDFWQIGYAPSGWKHLQQHFVRDIEGLKAVGLVRDSDKGRSFELLRDRIIFPIRNGKGRVVGFGGRAMNDEIKPKYINSPESVVFHKSEVLYGLFEGRQARAEQWLMVEGYMDVIALQQAGLAGAVATLGTATNAQHLETLFKPGDRNSQSLGTPSKQKNIVTLAFDGDSAGQRAAWRTLEQALPILQAERELRFLILPEQHDPDSLVRLEGIKGLKQRIAQAPPLSDFLFAILAQDTGTTTPEQKTRLLSYARAMTRMLPQSNRDYGYTLLKEYRDRLGLGFQSGKSTRVQEGLVSYDQPLSLEDVALIVLLNYPQAYAYLQELKSYIDPSARLHKALMLIEAVQQNRLPPQEEYLFFLIAAWPDEKERDQLCQLINRIDLNDIIFSAEKIKEWCVTTVLQLKQKHTKRTLQSNAATLQNNPEKLSFREQLARQAQIKQQEYELSLQQSHPADEA